MAEASGRDGATDGATDLVAELRRRGVEADDSPLTRALYSSDASLYRVLPRAVARPAHRDDLEAVLEAAALTATPLTPRGAGTSIAGNAIGPGLVVDTRRLNRVLEIDPEARTARVEPGVVHAALQAAAAPYGLRYGPDPSTHPRCTIGGMIGNNACGSRALGYGRTADTLRAVDVLWGDRAAAPGTVEERLRGLVAAELAHVRTTFGRFGRQVSGYSLEHLLPEAPGGGAGGMARFLAGTEGTLGLVREATVALVPEAPRRLLVLGYPSMAEAADAVPALLAAGGGALIACEGLDARLADLVRARRAVPELPRGSGWLLVEYDAGPSSEPMSDTGLGARLVAAGAALGHREVTDAGEAAALWRIREDGAGLAARSLSRPAHAGWEDAAVPPAALGAWLRDFEELLTAHGLSTVPYGHFGDGCVHARIDFDFADGGLRFREFLEACARRLADYGGSLSGEHGDGRARSELLPIMYDATSLRLFGQVKAACDPDGLLNPGVLVEPAPLDADLRPVRAERAAPGPRPMLRLADDGGSLVAATHRCTGVGKCVAPSGSGGVMCPSFLATGEERDSTRGRARVLQEALTGGLPGGLADPALHDALDLCLSCKGCASDCPTGVDMATYKSEALHRTYRRRPRPRSHYTLGRLPRWAALAAATGSARLANATLRWAPTAAAAKALAGVDARRTVPAFAATTLRRWARSRPDAGTPERPDVWLWADSFTDHFRDGPGRAAVAYLEACGLRVGVIDERACCGLTWITTGQLDQARRIVAGAVGVLSRYVDSGVPVVGLEPSCLAALRSDAAEVVPDADVPAAERVAAGVLTLAELVTRLDLPLPDLTGVSVLAQPHCHQHAVLGWEADAALLARAGAAVTRVPGCCGLAGNFGVERGHYETSVAVAETHLLPAVRSARAADPATVVLADGMSCALQLDDLAGVRALHLGELLAERLDGPPTERDAAEAGRTGPRR
ncbi:FAD-binding oxidoreductase [Nocardioides sp. GY 10113]|uniref:FAD-binding and (Fe-S)-binding domain-containing protein n=1 Tax=Nocardioides sp. GY 10113 TaxID=2569761 RepID=UPI0010A8261D|nr:FAD-binding and (Fe-S)-binding domain-containing protein [Nocardioides sp. GY 10113]TIC88203.1 FAD-binding oxidoreductase [Nocardioides sp. GY 10113]